MEAMLKRDPATILRKAKAHLNKKLVDHKHSWSGHEVHRILDRAIDRVGHAAFMKRVNNALRNL